jgi:predicted flap endonuclease-1-like 5' DNA nuclease
MAGALAQAEEQRQRADRLASELAGRDSKVGALEKRADKAGGELQGVQTRLTEAEGRAAELQSRVDELRGAQAEVDDLRARLEKADNEIESLRQRLKEADNEINNLRQRAEKADNEANNLRQRAKKADADRAEVERLRARVEELEASQQPAGPGQRTADSGQQAADSRERKTDTATPPDVSGAPAVLGKSIDPDDLTVIEGVGPKIASLLGDAGISTWRELSDAEPGRLRSILQDAGPRFRVHDPESWPRQAALLADGQWKEFKELRADVRSR